MFEVVKHICFTRPKFNFDTAKDIYFAIQRVMSWF